MGTAIIMERAEHELSFFDPHGPHLAPPETWGETMGAVSGVNIADNGEPLVDPRDLHRHIAFARTHPWIQFPRTPWVRERVGQMLAAAQDCLPEGYRIQIIEGYRSLERQRQLFETACSEMRRRHVDWTEEHVREAANAWVAAPDIAAPPPHSTGGAVDLTLVDADGAPVDMTGPLGWTEATAATTCEGLAQEVRCRRQALCTALEQAGLTNYPGEWWHWSFGEPGWAVRTGQAVAIYGAVEAQLTYEI